MTLNGHPKDQRTFTRVSGYVEQLDVHSPESTVREAALFSAALRLESEHAKCRERFVEVKGALGFPPGEEPTLSRLFTSHWSDGWFGGYYVWSHRYQNMIILLGFILFFRFATFYALERINYSTR